MKHRQSRWASRAATLILTVMAGAALSDSSVTTYQPAAVLAAGGGRLTSANLVGHVTVGESLTHPMQLTSTNLVMKPGYIAKHKLILSQDVPVDVEPDVTPAFVNRLDGGFPNPFNPRTTIRFTLAEAGPATLQVFDVRGRLVRALVTGTLAAGPHAIRWDGRSEGGSRVGSGVYFMRLTAGKFVQQKKLVRIG